MIVNDFNKIGMAVDPDETDAPLVVDADAVLAGFQDQTHKLSNALGLLNSGRGAQHAKTLLVITIEVEAAGGGSED